MLKPAEGRFQRGMMEPSKPAPVVDGDVKAAGKMPSVDEIKKWLSDWHLV